MGVLEGRSAIVTGSARGIGRATAELLAEHGARVLVNDLDEEVARAAAGEIAGETAVFTGDLTQEGVPERLVAAAVEAFGGVDIIVNNAGYALDAPIHKMSDDSWERMIDIHATVPFKVLRAAAPHLREPAKRERDEGREVFRKIVNVSSASGTMGSAAQANYAAGKAAVVGLTKTLAKEWGPLKVNCNAVAFGMVGTRMIEAMPDSYRERVEAMVPIGRAATPREAAGAIFFLCSPWSDYVQGQVLHVTGGMLAGMSA